MGGVEDGGHDLPAVARDLSDVAHDIAARSGLDDTLGEACRRALSFIDGCEAAGVGLARRGHSVETIAATSVLVGAVHAAQDELGEGPLIEAAWDEARFVQVDDLAKDERWPRFGKAAARAGARSLLCLPLLVDGGTLQALTVLSSKPAGFDEEARELAVMFASYVAVAVAGARTEDSLRHAVRTRQLIGEAVGILAERHQISTNAAFGNLSMISQERNIKVRELALRIVTEHNTQLPGAS